MPDGPAPRNPDDVARRLAGTALAGAPLIEVPLPEAPDVTWVIDLGDGDLVAAWREARDAVAGLGLYPVAVTTWGLPDWPAADLFSRFYYGRGDDVAPWSVITRSSELSVDEALLRFGFDDDWAAENWDDVVRHHVELAQRHAGAAPDEAVFADVPAGDELRLERRLMAWEEDQRPTDPPEPSESVGWFDPRPEDPAGLVLLPITEPWQVAGYLAFYGADGEGRHEALLRLMREWQGRFGAQLVASWGTMLQFAVSAPPGTLEEAFDLAAQHAAVAPCTTMLPGEGIRQLARHLWRGERWFLHERP